MGTFPANVRPSTVLEAKVLDQGGPFSIHKTCRLLKNKDITRNRISADTIVGIVPAIWGARIANPKRKEDAMNTGMKNQHRLMIITVVAGLILAAVAFLKPALAEAGVVVRARVGTVGIAVSTDSPRGLIVQTGPRSYRCDVRVRPPRPIYGRYVWVPGHYEEILVKKNYRKFHKGSKVKPGKIQRTRFGYVKVERRHPRFHRYNHYRVIWVSGHWERI